MALTITKSGNSPQKEIWQGSCRTCNAEAECCRLDIPKIQRCPRESYEFAWVKCPECGNTNQGLLMYPVLKSAN